MVTTWDNHVCHTNLHKGHRRKKNNNSSLWETCASPECHPSSFSVATMAAPKKEMNNRYTEIWESTIACKDAFWADEPGRRMRWYRDFVAPRPGIFPITTRSRRCQLHPMHSKKSNVAACRHPHAQLQDTKYNYSSQHDRHPRECRPSTIRPKSR
jgi:hypothetical protein